MICKSGGCGRLTIQQPEWVDQHPSSHDAGEIFDSERAIFGPWGREHQRVCSCSTGERVGAPHRKRHNGARDYRIVNAGAKAAVEAEMGTPR